MRRNIGEGQALRVHFPGDGLQILHQVAELLVARAQLVFQLLPMAHFPA